MTKRARRTSSSQSLSRDLGLRTYSEDEGAFRDDHMRRCAERLREIQRRRPNPYEPSGESEDQRIIREHYEAEDINQILSELDRYNS